MPQENDLPPSDPLAAATQVLIQQSLLESMRYERETRLFHRIAVALVQKEQFLPSNEDLRHMASLMLVAILRPLADG